MNLRKRFLLSCGLMLLSAIAALGQTTYSTTTLSANIKSKQDTFCVASVTGMTGHGVQYNTYLAIDKELIAVETVNTTTNCLKTTRGINARAREHLSGATVYFGTPSQFAQFDPNGACQAFSTPVTSPVFSVESGAQFTCDTVTGLWVKSIENGPYEFTDGAFPFSWADCQSSVSGNSTGTNGYTTAGASNTPVVQAQTSNVGTNTHTYVCKIKVPERLTANKGFAITDVTFYYGVQSNALGTQVNTLASGTFNSSIVFSKIVYPAAGASETASAVTPVRLDSGTMVATPVVASFNAGTTTAGAFLTEKFAPAAPIFLNTDLQDFLFTVTLQCAATTATITNSPGGIVHFNNFPL